MFCKIFSCFLYLVQNVLYYSFDEVSLIFWSNFMGALYSTTNRDRFVHRQSALNHKLCNNWQGLRKFQYFAQKSPRRVKVFWPNDAGALTGYVFHIRCSSLQSQNF